MIDRNLRDDGEKAAREVKLLLLGERKMDGRRGRGLGLICWRGSFLLPTVCSKLVPNRYTLFHMQ